MTDTPDQDLRREAVARLHKALGGHTHYFADENDCGWLIDASGLLDEVARLREQLAEVRNDVRIRDEVLAAEKDHQQKLSRQVGDLREQLATAEARAAKAMNTLAESMEETAAERARTNDALAFIQRLRSTTERKV